MSQSLSNVLIHLVFSTANRTNWIDAEIQTEVHSYLAATCRSFGCPAIKIGGTENHVHILCRLSRTISISNLVVKIKTASSKWIKTKGNQYNLFAWQKGYGAFSIGESNVEALKKYIENQEKHHKQRSFQDELRSILKKYKIEYDERYLWD